MINEGVSLESLAQQVADPKSHVDIQIQMITSITGIPKRILTGSERGELASSQDRDNWFDLIDGRREEFAEPQIVVPFVDRMIEFGVLPEPEEEYAVVWTDLRTASDKDKAEVGKIRSESLKSYVGTPGAQDTIPPETFFSHFLGLDEDQIKLIKESWQKAIDDESRDFEEEV